jgi:hypothetical protein
MLDPLVSFHAVDENNNTHMDVVIKEGFGAVANRTDSAGEVFQTAPIRPARCFTTLASLSPGR